MQMPLHSTDSVLPNCLMSVELFSDHRIQVAFVAPWSCTPSFAQLNDDHVYPVFASATIVPEK